MPFLKRLGYFLIGLSIGLIFLALFLKRKTDETGTEFCYLPNCRVLKELRSKPMQIDTSLKTNTDSLLIKYLLQEGDVDFSKSDTRAEPCKIYRISGSKEERTLRITIENCDSYTLLTEYEEDHP
jgi:hypothetical protein